MKVLIFGPSGSGKTYVAKALQRAGINAFDDADIEGLSNWYNRDAKKITEPTTADEALNNGYAFLWSRKTLARFIEKYPDVYVFGGSGNITSVFDLFDKVYFLKIDPELQRERLLSPLRPTPMMDVNDDGFVIWGAWLEQLATERNIPFLDASKSPEEIFELISKYGL